MPLYARSPDLSGRGFGPLGVSFAPHFVLKLGDGTEIATKVWFPTGKVDLGDDLEIVDYCEEEEKVRPIILMF